MIEFAQLTKKAFESYYNIPYEPAEWGVTDAFGHVNEFMAHHESIDEMPGLCEALEKMSPQDWDIWLERYPEQRESVIEPARRKVAEHAY